jgi:DNA-binding beta-propeller fold protein YncE
MPRVSLGRSVLHRPAGVGVAPWDDGVNMYIAGTDGRHVLVIDRNRMKLVHQLSTPDMLYPHGIAFSKHLHEVYVTGSTSLHVVIYQVVPQNLKVQQNLCSETLF